MTDYEESRNFAFAKKGRTQILRLMKTAYPEEDDAE
jgi:hypothetical protein